jgi:hypothetical protein
VKIKAALTCVNGYPHARAYPLCMANVSLLGAVGGTITMPMTSANNAAVAQSALAGINDAVTSGTLTEVVQTGADLAPTAQPSVVVLQPTTALPPIEIGNGYVAAVLDGPQQQALISGVTPDETVVSGIAGAIVGNLAPHTEAFLGGGNNAFLELGGAGFSPSASVWLDGAAYMDLSAGATTVFASTGASVDLVNTGTGANVVNFEESNPAAGTNMIGISGSTESSATVNAVGAGLVAVQNGGAAVINANESNVTVYGGPGPNWNGEGSVTLYGGMGSDSVSDGTGYFQAGTGGGSQLTSSSIAGAATLVGGGSGDTLIAQERSHDRRKRQRDAHRRRRADRRCRLGRRAVKPCHHQHGGRRQWRQQFLRRQRHHQHHRHRRQQWRQPVRQSNGRAEQRRHRRLRQQRRPVRRAAGQCRPHQPLLETERPDLHVRAGLRPAAWPGHVQLHDSRGRGFERNPVRRRRDVDADRRDRASERLRVGRKARGFAPSTPTKGKAPGSGPGQAFGIHYFSGLRREGPSRPL